MINPREQFLAWERASTDTIDVKRIYIDMAGDLISGVLLSQIMFWHLPNRETGRTKLRLRHMGNLWMAKKREDWWHEWQ